jgi:hypothetical protein
MKKIITICAAILMTSSLFAQAPNKMSYQAVIRNNTNALVANQAVGMRISILQTSPSGTAVYVETQTPSTNTNGLVSIEIGGGAVVSGNFSNINWANGPYFIQTESDPNGGTSYNITGTSQLLSVPYALYAENCGGLGNIVTPTITTNAVTGITSNSATFGGVISNANGDQIMERGIVYSISPNPTLSSNKIIIGSGIGTFDTISALSYQYTHLLNSNTTYYVRAYAITENNIASYGNQVSFTTHSVGQVGPGGGLVFFDKGNNNGGWQYLETATSDQSTGIAWGCDGTSIPGTQLTVGSGEANTSLIVAGCNEASFAAKICDNLSLGGQSDWFLPALDELYLVYKNLHQNGQGNFNGSWGYWSSSDYTTSMAFFINFTNGNYNGLSGGYKNISYNVRAVRAF